MKAHALEQRQGASKNPPVDIAVIGMACRFPGADDYRQFWQNLAQERSSVSEIPTERWNKDAYYAADPDVQNRGVSKWGGFIADADKFDAAFFRVSPREAELMDPQQRIMLELAFSCLEDAGYSPSAIRGSQTGVYLGVCNFDYKEVLERESSPIEAHLATGTYAALIPNRISFEYDLKGPSVPFDTACSSALVALHDAVHALRRGDCSMALVGGVSILCSPTYFVSFSKAGMLSPDGACRTFDHRANGYVRGEGAGLILLKPLAQAIADHDKIVGVIKGSAVNHGGRVQSVTSPSAFAQSRAIVEANRNAGISPETVSYIEAHGTGTPKGDPIEIHALQRAFNTLAGHYGVTLKEGSCGLGSVKTNIGHLEPAAGIAGVIKVLLSMQHRALPGLLHYSQLNPRIRLDGSPFYLVRGLQEWKPSAAAAVLRAGCSSFGFGGVNAHVVLEEYRPPVRRMAPGTPPQPFVLSAKSATALQRYAQQLLAHLETGPAQGLLLEDIAYTLWRREPMPERAGFVAGSLAELKAQLASLATGVPGGEGLYRGNAAGSAERTTQFQVGGVQRPVLDQWLAQRNLAELLSQWVAGLVVDWDSLSERDSATRPRLAGLPTYPFERTRYWLPDVTSSPYLSGTAVMNTVAPRSDAAPPAVWSVQTNWHERSLRTQASAVGNVNHRPLCLTVLAPTGLSGLADERPMEARTIAISPPADAHDGASWVVACWQAMEQVQAELTQYQPSMLLLLSNTDEPFAAALFALLQSVQKELNLPTLWYAWERTTGLDEAALGRSILKDAAAAPTESGARRLRWVLGQLLCAEPTWELSTLPAVAPVPSWALGGVYWICGGGGIGQKIALHLATKYAASVIISGRSVPGPQGLAESIPSGGGSISYRTADCTKRHELESVLAFILATHGRLTGVIHTAGVLKDRSLFAKSAQDVATVMAPKVIGALLLDEVTRRCALECFVLFSSVSGVWGNPGQTDYAAANAFLTQFAGQRQLQVDRGERSGESMVIHWPYWEQGGMRLPHDLLTRLAKSLGTAPMPDAPALDAFDRVLAARARECTLVFGVAPVLTAALGQLTGRQPMPSAPVIPAVSACEPPTLESVQRTVQQAVAELTGSPLAMLSLETHFAELGVDSILLQTLVRRVNDAYRLTLSASEAFSHPSIREFAALIMSQRAAAVSVASRAESIPPTSSRPQRRQAAGAHGEPADSDVAITGVNLNIAGATSPAELWSLLTGPPRPPTAYPEERWDLLPKTLIGALRREDCPGFFLPNALGFDHAFFGISPREGMLLDPQQRLLLHSVWHAIENAGYRKTQFARRPTAVFLAIDSIDYEHVVRLDPRIDEFTSTGVARYIAANRLSHVFNLSGLSETVDTACSSFFVGLARALDAMRNGTVEQAIVAGVQLNILPTRFRVLRERGLLSRNGRTLPFDQSAEGFVRSEGVGSVVLKPLRLAQRDNDPIYAVIKGVGVWHGGTALGIAAPNALAHRAAIKQALARGFLAVDRIAYMEGHGTAMPLGDASELVALEQVFQELGRDPQNKCFLGAAKAALGHLEAASGAAALIKVILSLQKRQVPGLPHLQNPQPPLCPGSILQTAATEQALPPPADGSPLVAGLLSYGLGGVSACVLLEEHGGTPAPASARHCSGPQAVVVSAQSESALTAYLRNLHAFLAAAGQGTAETRFQQLVETFQHRREPMAHRVAILAHDAAELAAKIEQTLAQQTAAGVYRSHGAVRAGLDSDPSPAMMQWLTERDWPKLASAWVGGADIPWPAAVLPRGGSLEYPFSTERKLWISHGGEAS